MTKGTYKKGAKGTFKFIRFTLIILKRVRILARIKTKTACKLLFNKRLILVRVPRTGLQMLICLTGVLLYVVNLPFVNACKSDTN